MKKSARTPGIIAWLFVAATFAGCKSRDESSTQQAPEQHKLVEEQLDEAKAKTDEAARSVRDYTYAEKDELIAKMRRELASIEKDLVRLSSKVENSAGAARVDAQAKLEVVRQKWVRANKQLDEAENATESSWDRAKNGFKDSYEDLKASFEDSRRWLSDKIEP